MPTEIEIERFSGFISRFLKRETRRFLLKSGHSFEINIRYMYIDCPHYLSSRHFGITMHVYEAVLFYLVICIHHCQYANILINI